MKRRLLLAFALLAGPAACAFGLDGYTGGGGVSAGEGGLLDAANSAGNTTFLPDGALAPGDSGGGTHTFTKCPSAHGPEMVLLSDGAGTRFCIDSTEVTIAQYKEFASAAPSTDGQGAECAWNTSFLPSNTSAYDNIARQIFPITYVDFCDARAYCKWAGKRLCGRIGGGSLSSASDRTNAAVSQFEYACTRGGKQSYLYGNTYMIGYCNADGRGAIEPPGARGFCVGGFDGIVDLIGNVSEWQDDCESSTGANDNCPDNSSTWENLGATAATANRCDHFDAQKRSDTYDDLGFRCCYD